MVALKGRAIEGFVKKRDPTIAAVLIYGPDQGLVRERSDVIALQVAPDLKDAFNVTSFSDADLKSDPARLADETAAQSLMGGDRVVRVRITSEAIAGPAIFNLIEALDGGHLKPAAFVIVEGPEFDRRKSKLLPRFEKSSRCATLPCYVDNIRDIRALAMEMTRAEGLAFDEDALSLLTATLGEDRGVTRSEIAKLITYCGPAALRSGPGRISLADVRANLADGVGEALDEAAAAAADGDMARLSRALHQSAVAGAAPVTLLRALSRQINRLAEAQALIASGKSVEDAMKSLRPQVFFMEEKAFAARLRSWSPAMLDRALDLLIEAEFSVKTTGLPAWTMGERAALSIAGIARRGRSADG